MNEYFLLKSNRKSYVLYGYVPDDLTWHQTPQTTQIFAFFVAFDTCVVGQHRDFKFGTQDGRS